MTLDQILEIIDFERGLEARFPVRLIFTNDLDQYDTLIKSLSQKCDITINISDFCASDDIYPNFRKLFDFIKNNIDKQILVLSMEEYLRFRIKREMHPDEAKFSSFWQMQFDASSKIKVYAPLFAGRELFDRVVPFLDDRQIDNIWELSSIDNGQKTYSISVYSKKFQNSIPTAIIGVKKWFRIWLSEMKQKGGASVVTSLFNNVENSNGKVNIRVIDNPFDYVCHLVQDGQRLKREWASDEQWANLIPLLISNEHFQKTILSELNLMNFDPLSIMARWDVLKPFDKQLVWIWYQLEIVDDYYGFVFRSIEKLEGIKEAFRDMIIQRANRLDWIEQRRHALNVLKNVRYGPDFFAMLNALPLPETRLNLLTYSTHEERAFALFTISNWLRQGVSVDGVLEVLAGNYPLFEEYISKDIVEFPGLHDYFSWYRNQKVTNRVLDISPPVVDLDRFESRFSLLSKFNESDCYVIWVDGMGVEWLPLLVNQLNLHKGSCSISSDVATALLPTETHINDQWKDFNFEYEKLNRLDELNHKGLPDDKDYYSCIDNQFSIITDIAKKALGHLNSHEVVIITADHGSSRLAALSFHNSFGCQAPKNAIIKSFGRYCELNGPLAANEALPFAHMAKQEGKSYLVMKTHDHFAIGGNPAGGNDAENAICGEIHGGGTPEEYLVPIIVLRRQGKIPIVDYFINNKIVTRNLGFVTIELSFTSDVSSLEVAAENIKGTCRRIEHNLWEVTLAGVEIRDYKIDVVANRHVLSKKEIISVNAKGIELNDDPFSNF